MDHQKQCHYCNKIFNDCSALRKHLNKKTTCIKITNGEIKGLYEKVNEYNKYKQEYEQKIKDANEKVNRIMFDMKEMQEVYETTISELKTQLEQTTSIKNFLNDHLEIMENRLIDNADIKTINNINNIIIIENAKPFSGDCFDINDYDIEEHLLRGVEGFVKFMYDNILFDKNGKYTNYVCMDASRKKCKRLDENLEWIDDINGSMLCREISRKFKGNTGMIYNKYLDTIAKYNLDDITRMETDNKINEELINIRQMDEKYYQNVLKKLMPMIMTTREELKKLEFKKRQ